MRLLIFTQKIDRTDSVLGFFHGWVSRLAEKADAITVICLEEANLEDGRHSLPTNVTVHSLGKERYAYKGVFKLAYVFKLFAYLRLIRGTYDRVFVHMNQEYVVLCGVYWRFLEMPVYFWRNHPDGNMFSRFAVAMSTKVFATSSSAYTAQFKKTKLMPAGIDTQVFTTAPNDSRKKYSVCMVGRVSPIKRIDLGLEAVNEFVRRGVQISFAVVGSPTDRDSEYYQSLVSYVENNRLSPYVQFTPAVKPDSLADVYSQYEICLNLTKDGSFDKTIIEAAACGTIPLVSNTSLRPLLPPVCMVEPNVPSICEAIERLHDASMQVATRDHLASIVSMHSLDALIERLVEEMR